MTPTELANREASMGTGVGGVIVTAFSDGTDLTVGAKELFALTAGPLSVLGADGVQVDFLAADLVALNNRVPFAVKRIRTTGTGGTRYLAVS